MNRQQRRAMLRAKDEQLRQQAKVAVELEKPAVRLQRLEAVVYNALVPDMEKVINVLKEKGLVVEVTESGIIKPSPGQVLKRP